MPSPNEAPAGSAEGAAALAAAHNQAYTLGRDGQAKPDTILVLHGGIFTGQSEKIAHRVEDVLRARGHAVEFAPLSEYNRLNPMTHRGVAIVTSVRYGHFDPKLAELVTKRRAIVDALPTLLMTVSLTARNTDHRDPALHPPTRDFLRKTGWRPWRTEVVAGALRYPLYKWWQVKCIQMIMRMTDGPTDPSLDIEYTDWDQVATAATEWAELVERLA
jgi:menaquinone-dependent protoporphyrinogen oxidase